MQTTPLLVCFVIVTQWFDNTNNLSQVGSSILNNFNKLVSLLLFTCLTTSSKWMSVTSESTKGYYEYFNECVSRVIFPSLCDRIEMHVFHPRREWMKPSSE
jgi:hypothetical protein